MKSNDVMAAIEEWTAWASKPETNCYDVALLKIWISFEHFLGELFVNYAIGNASETGYHPKLKIQFQDEEHFNVFMREKNTMYIEYLEKIEKLSRHIFYDNPFDVLLLDADNKRVFAQLKALRNYIVHESGSAKRKVIDICFSGDERRFMEPNKFLLSKEPSTRTSYYTYYTTMISNIVQAVIVQTSI
ncbi:MAG: hypothetical protein IKO94_11785 [Selenomonadaceae bacterium]|nr:hypothetical protein [Selenomonadaceae bacterium]